MSVCRLRNIKNHNHDLGVAIADGHSLGYIHTHSFPSNPLSHVLAGQRLDFHSSQVNSAKEDALSRALRLI